MQIEYFLWPLEINSYLYKPDDDKITILNNIIVAESESNLNRWQNKTRNLGSLFAGATFVTATVLITLTEESLNYIVRPWFYVFSFSFYSMQNWVFFWYL